MFPCNLAAGSLVLLLAQVTVHPTTALPVQGHGNHTDPDLYSLDEQPQSCIDKAKELCNHCQLSKSCWVSCARDHESELRAAGCVAPLNDLTIAKTQAKSNRIVFGCMYQCSPGGHHMDRGGCFYNGCPSPGSSQAGEICFGAAGDPFGHDMLEFGSSGASACLEYIHRSESTSYHTRSSAMREFFDRSSMSNSTAVALRGDVEKSGFFNFLWRAYTVYRGVLNAARCYTGDWWACANVIRMLVFDEHMNATAALPAQGYGNHTDPDLYSLDEPQSSTQLNATSMNVTVGGVPCDVCTEILNYAVGYGCDKALCVSVASLCPPCGAACGVIEEGADLICGCSLCDFIQQEIGTGKSVEEVCADMHMC